jgi:predicted enzyme related to lactoylglutathione lyase
VERLKDRALSLATAPRYAGAMLKLAINIDVDNLEKGVAFYAGAFDLKPLRRFGATAVELEGAQARVYILEKAPAAPPFPGAKTLRDYGRHWTPVHVDLLVDDIEQARGRALKAGASAESEVETFGWGRMVLMADPFGNGFCLIQLDAAGYEVAVTPY